MYLPFFPFIVYRASFPCSFSLPCCGPEFLVLSWNFGQDMVLESKTTSPRWRQNSITSTPFKKQQAKLDELGSFSTLVHRHRFLLTAFALLTFLCTIYLYLAVTFGANQSCSGFSGAQKSMCHIQQAKDFVYKGKLKNLS